MTIQRQIRHRGERRVITEFYRNEILLGHADIRPFNLYKDYRINFRDEFVPDTIDITISGNVCSADLIDLENGAHDAFFDSIYEYMKLPHFKIFLINIKEPLLYDFYLQHFPPYKVKMQEENKLMSWSWLEDSETRALIDSWNVPFNFETPATTKMMMVYKELEFHHYQNASWIKRRIELSNGEYV